MVAEAWGGAAAAGAEEAGAAAVAALTAQRARARNASSELPAVGTFVCVRSV